ncbi:hypothetical protein [Paraburkholderia acidipaludis]|nr:hypothetical protein [Paraburkholderia acidipaludis]
MQFYASALLAPIRALHGRYWQQRLFAAMQQYGANARLASQIAQDW